MAMPTKRSVVVIFLVVFFSFLFLSFVFLLGL